MRFITAGVLHTPHSGKGDEGTVLTSIQRHRHLTHWRLGIAAAALQPKPGQRTMPIRLLRPWRDVETFSQAAGPKKARNEVRPYPGYRSTLTLQVNP